MVKNCQIAVRAILGSSDHLLTIFWVCVFGPLKNMFLIMFAKSTIFAVKGDSNVVISNCCEIFRAWASPPSVHFESLQPGSVIYRHMSNSLEPAHLAQPCTLLNPSWCRGSPRRLRRNINATLVLQSRLHRPATEWQADPSSLQISQPAYAVDIFCSTSSKRRHLVVSG